MEYRIERREAFRIIGKRVKLDGDLEQNCRIVINAWAQAIQDGTVLKLGDLADIKHRELLGVSTCNKENEWEYFVAAISDKKTLTGMDEYTVKASTWAIFRGKGEQISMHLFIIIVRNITK